MSLIDHVWTLGLLACVPAFLGYLAGLEARND